MFTNALLLPLFLPLSDVWMSLSSNKETHVVLWSQKKIWKNPLNSIYPRKWLCLAYSKYEVLEKKNVLTVESVNSLLRPTNPTQQTECITLDKRTDRFIFFILTLKKSLNSAFPFHPCPFCRARFIWEKSAYKASVEHLLCQGPELHLSSLVK